MESCNLIFSFLKRMRLEKHYDMMISNSFFKLNSIDDFQYVLKNICYLRDIGLSSAEINRFKRMYEKAMKDVKEGLQNSTENFQGEKLLGKELEIGPISTKRIIKNTIPNNSQDAKEEYGPKCSDKDKLTSKTQLKIEINVTKPIVKKEKIRDHSHVCLRYKLLIKDDIKTEKILNINFPSPHWYNLKYFHLIELFSSKTNKEYLCPSVELYHSSGSPLVTSPIDYFKCVEDLLHWRELKMIYILPKNINHTSERFHFLNASNPKSHFSNIPIHLFELNFETGLKIQSTSTIYVIQLILGASKLFHLPRSCLAIYLKYPGNKIEKNLADDTAIPLGNILKNQIIIYLYVSQYFWKGNDFYNAFGYNNYVPIINHSSDILIYFNAVLLYLIRDSILGHKLEMIRSLLSKLEQISCSPPLVHSLQLLLSQQVITLPHKIAIMEGLIMTLQILNHHPKDNILEEISFLWPYLQKFTGPLVTDDNELINVSQKNKGSTLTENASDQKYLNSIPNFCSDIILSKEQKDDYREFPKIRDDFATFKKSRSYPHFYHPIQIYEYFFKNKTANGLIRLSFSNKLTPCVFLGHSSKPFKVLECYSPLENRKYSFNPFEVNIKERYTIYDVNKYSKLLIILDVSNDMHTMLDGEKISRTGTLNGCIPTYLQINTALILIDIIIDTLIGSNFKYLLGITLVSNEHDFKYGYLELVPLTLEYCYAYRKLQEWIEDNPPFDSVSRRNLPNGCILSALRNYTSREYKKTEIILFTNQGFMNRYYGKDVHNTYLNIQEISYVVNVILFGKSIGKRLETLCTKSKGVFINYEKVQSKGKNLKYWDSYFSSYIVLIREIMENNSIISLQSTAEVTKFFKDRLMTVEKRIKTSCESLTHSPKLVTKIINFISQYSNEPKNLNLELYSLKDDVTNWILYIRNPSNNNYTGIFHILLLSFPANFPLKPPNLKFLTSIIHPNVYRNGKICHPILLERYDARITLKNILDSIFSMVNKPVVTHLVNSNFGETYLLRDSSYKLQVSCVNKIIGIACMPRREQEDCLNIDSLPSHVHPSDLVCPITRKLFDNPVITPDGNTYEKSAIIDHLNIYNEDPQSHNPLKLENLIPNLAIGDCVLKYRRQLKIMKDQMTF